VVKVHNNLGKHGGLGLHPCSSASVCNHIHKSPNRHSTYEENINYGERDMKAFNLVKKVELPLEKKYVQPQLLVTMTTPVEERPPPPPPLMITTEIKNNDDSFEVNDKVEDDIQEEIIGGIFMEVNEKEKSCLDAICVDFFKYLFSEEPLVLCLEENSLTSFFQVGVSDEG
jgi:hypothetical protein